MNWVNIDQLKNSDQPQLNSQSAVDSSKPPQRWGQACIQAHNKFYIIGGYDSKYLGDIWEFNFETMNYTQIVIEGPAKQQLERSNHTAVYYPPHQAIYVFGGGQAQRQRFNDTIKISIADINMPQKKGTLQKKTAYAEQVQIKPNSQLPSARTYHAACLIGKFMIVTGGEANSDLNDMWALDLEEQVWHKPELQFEGVYTPKRFHTMCKLSETQVVTFGGCHSEYVHMNEMHIFELANFFIDPLNIENQVKCTKVNVTEGVPSTRWGHAAAEHDGKLYILGGRNEVDIVDLHEFDPARMRWKEIPITQTHPKPRRRHSAVFVSGALVMFGGFDGNFYNDLNILDFMSVKKQIISIQQSTINQDYKSLVNSSENSDIVFLLDNPLKQKVNAHRALVLFRLVQRECQQENAEEQKISNIVVSQQTPEFIKNVYLSKPGSEVFLPKVNCKQSLIKLLEYLYCDKFVDHVTVTQIKKVSEICKVLGLKQLHNLFKNKAELAKLKIHQNLVTEYLAQNPNSNVDHNSIPKQQMQSIMAKVNELESKVKLDFSSFDDLNIQSPEDKQEKLHNKAMNHMSQCKNLDDFYDVLFYVEDTLIKANSTVLQARCPYFFSMLSNKYQFKESQTEKGSYIRVQGVSKLYFSCIIQYIYSDHFYIQKQDPEFFIKLLIFADYFMLPRLVDICSSYLKQYVNIKSALQLYLLSHAHNAAQLEKYCLNFIAIHERDIFESRYYLSFKRQAHDSLLKCFTTNLGKEKDESFVQICMHRSQGYQTNPSQSQSQSQRGSFGVRNISSAPQKKYEEEIDIDALLNTPNYIYLEEHHKYYSQEQLQSSQSYSSINVHFNKISNLKTKVSQEEVKSAKNSLSAQQTNYFNQENSHPNLPLQQSHQSSKRKGLTLTKDQGISFGKPSQITNPAHPKREALGTNPYGNIHSDDSDDESNLIVDENENSVNQLQIQTQQKTPSKFNM